jgi:hypothetical protein
MSRQLEAEDEGRFIGLVPLRDRDYPRPLLCFHVARAYFSAVCGGE